MGHPSPLSCVFPCPAHPLPPHTCSATPLGSQIISSAGCHLFWNPGGVLGGGSGSSVAWQGQGRGWSVPQHPEVTASWRFLELYPFLQCLSPASLLQNLMLFFCPDLSSVLILIQNLTGTCAWRWSLTTFPLPSLSKGGSPASLCLPLKPRGRPLQSIGICILF